MKLAHFYHVYADGHWEDAAFAHVEALESSGLLDELDEMFLGIVGGVEKRAVVKRELPGVVITECDEGWEQVTLQALHEYSKENSAKILYAHTKGAWSNSELARQWRVSMTYDTVTRWREAVEALQECDVAGPYWFQSREPEHVDHEHIFGGNFWWARSDYVSTLDPVQTDTRFRAEGWVGLKQPRAHVLRTGYPFWGNFWSNDEA
jgi:hypothetical protein